MTFGRTAIMSPHEKITIENLPAVLDAALAQHNENSREIDFLWSYARGDQPILTRKKNVRPEICNRVVENHAIEIASFASSYFLGEPVAYVRRGDSEEAAESIGEFNNYMYLAGKEGKDKELATWMSVCGVGYRMILPTESEDGGAPFLIDVLDPRDTFVVYYSGFGRKKLLAAQKIEIVENGIKVNIVCGYTATHYFEYRSGKVVKFVQHVLGSVPVFEFRLNMMRMGSFEPAIPLLDAINRIESNRVDGIEQFVQAFLKFKNCQLEEADLNRFVELGAIMLPPTERGDADVGYVIGELNQQQTQTLVDYMYDQVLAICGLPTSTKGGSSTSDTGSAVFLRDGWSQCEARAKDTELLFKESEKDFIRLAIRICRENVGLKLNASDVECKLVRRHHDNLLTKTQSLLHMLEAGIEPGIAIATCNLFSDPMDVAAVSAPYLKKWEYEEVNTYDEDTEEPVPVGGQTVETA